MISNNTMNIQKPDSQRLNRMRYDPDLFRPAGVSVVKAPCRGAIVYRKGVVVTVVEGRARVSGEASCGFAARSGMP